MNDLSSVPAAVSLPPWRALLIAIRPATLLAGLGPILVGISLGIYERARLGMIDRPIVGPSLAAVILVILLQASANLVNDAKDSEKGVDHGPRLGPVRVVQSGLLSPRAVRATYRGLFLLAAAVAFALFWPQRDWLIPAVATLCGLAAYLYTAGPLPLAYYALGEALACWFFGPIAVMGTVYLLTGQVLWSTAGWGLGCGFIAAAIMSINNYRDRLGDRQAGKHTLATILGEDLGAKLPLYFVLMSVGVLVFFGLEHGKSIIAVPWSLLAMMFIRRRIVPRLKDDGPLLNEALRFTALFNLFYALLFATLVLL